MQYTKYELLPYNLHIINTKKFKTVNIRINFKTKAVKEDLTKRNFLSDLLLRSTSNYHSEKEMAIKCEVLYDLNYSSSCNISGNYSILSFDTTFLNEKFTEEGMLEQSISFFLDMITKPDVKNHKFNSDTFNITKKNIHDILISEKDNPNHYSFTELMKIIDKDSPISYNSNGYLEDLEKINESNLYDYYENLLKSNLIDIFIVGDVDNTKIKEIFADKFKINTFKKNKEKHIIEHKQLPKRAKSKKITADFTQSQLLLGYKISAMNDFERNYVSTIYSFILGGGPDSKLFQTVREKNSLCYSINSIVYKTFNLLIIKSGIDKNDYKKAVSLIKKEVANMNKSKITEEELEKAKITYINSCKEILDSPSSIIGVYVAKEYLNTDLLEDRIKNIEKVTKDMVVSFGKKLYLDTIFLLEGGLASEGE